MVGAILASGRPLSAGGGKENPRVLRREGRPVTIPALISALKRLFSPREGPRAPPGMPVGLVASGLPTIQRLE
jgi:hypothetical protein